MKGIPSTGKTLNDAITAIFLLFGMSANATKAKLNGNNPNARIFVRNEPTKDIAEPYHFLKIKYREKR